LENITVKDLNANIVLYGRNFMVESDGTAYGTKVIIDDKEISNLTEVNINIKARHLVEVTMKFLDIG
jgi:hypothetical protein